MSNISRQRQRYQRLAYSVVRDAIGFKFGIPIFLKDNLDRTPAKEYLISLKIREGTEITDKVISLIEEKIEARLNDLEEDLSHCEELLGTDNVWLQLLDLTPESLQLYLANLTEEEKIELALIPKWTTLDCALGRTFINDEFSLGNERTDGFS